jgi:hypothetical protein
MPCDVFRIALRDESAQENVFAYTMEAGVRYYLPNAPQMRA